MNTVLLVVILLVLLADLAVTVHLDAQGRERRAADRLDERVEEAQEKEQREQRLKMDEGFENIMSFSVKGKSGLDG